MTPAQARKKLKACVSRLGGQKQVADLIGCSRSFLCLVLQGKRAIKSAKHSAAIEQHFDIPYTAWLGE